MAIAARQHTSAAGRAERVDDERIPKANAFPRELVQSRRFEPGKAGLVALLFLHDAKAIPTPIVGVEVDDVWPLLVVGGVRFNCDAVRSSEYGKETYGGYDS